MNTEKKYLRQNSFTFGARNVALGEAGLLLIPHTTGFEVGVLRKARRIGVVLAGLRGTLKVVGEHRTECTESPPPKRRV